MEGDSGHTLLVLCTVFVWLLGTLLACPDVCLCPGTTNHVTCVGAELSDVPRSLPPSTTNLDLSNNEIHTVSGNSLSHLRSVITLKLKDNQIETIHDGAFEALQSLQSLDVGGNRLSTLSEYTFTGAASTLTHLDLSNNDLEDVDAAFVSMKELSRLDLHNNRIQTITQFTFRDLTSLRYLLLAGNQINAIDRRSFRKLDKLMYLVLKGNPIGSVERFQFNSYFLSYVDLSECGLTSVPRGLPSSIRYLQLRRNNMTVVQRRAFQDCPHVSILVLDENGITDIQANTFEHMTYLQQLWLNSNKLRHLPRLLPASLQRLLMDSNRVTQIEDVFPEESQIHTLSFMGNNITMISYEAFYKLPKLKSIDFSNNRIQHIYGNTFIESGELRTIQLSKNPLQYFHSRAFHGLGSLQSLSLAYIGTSVSMYEDIFDDLTSVTKLDLDASPYIIKTILSTDRLARSFPALEDLSLQSSELTRVRADFADLFPYLGVLHISSTRWHCDKSMIWFRDWLIAEPVHVENKASLHCFTPRALYDRSIIALSDSEFVPTTDPPPTITQTAKLTTFRPTVSTTTRADKPAQNGASSSLTTTTTTTTTTMSSKATTTTTAKVKEVEDADEVDEDPDEDTFNINFKDLYGDGEIDESDEKYWKFFPPESAPKTSSEKPPSWEDYFGNSKKPGGGDSPPKQLPPSSDESKYNSEGLQNDNLEIRTLNPQDDPHPTVAPSSEDEGGGHGTLIIVIATTLATVIIAAVIIALIIYLSRKQRTAKKPEQNGGVMYKNGGIKYKNRNDVLYFMPGKGGEGSTTDSIQTTTSRECMSLIPGRDINHEGPLRVYKWEDF